MKLLMRKAGEKMRRDKAPFEESLIPHSEYESTTVSLEELLSILGSDDGEID